MTVDVKRRTASARHSADTRQRLMEAGTTAFALAGFHGAKVSRIAEDAGVANGTFYLHFSDKLELFTAIAEEAALDLARSLRSVRDAHSGDPDASDRAEVDVLVAFAENHPHLLRTAYAAPPGDNFRWLGILSLFADQLERDLRQAVTEGHVRRDIDLEVAAHAGVGMFLHVLVWWGDDGYRIPRERVIETLFRLRRGATATMDRAGSTTRV